MHGKQPPTIVHGTVSPSQSARVLWIDRAKAVGIVLVVAGHVAALPREVTDYIYRFHMPLFFLLAGAVVSPKRLQEGFRSWVGRQARALLLPYLFFWALSTAWWLIVRNIGEKALESAGIPLWAPVAGLLWGTGESLFVNPPLWFFPATFVSAIAFWGVWRLSKGTGSGMGIAVLGLWAFSAVMPPSPAWAKVWNLDLLPWTCTAYTMGYLARNSIIPAWQRFVRSGERWPAGITALALAVGAAACYLPAWDWSGREFGPLPGLSLVASLVIAATFCWLLDIIPGKWSGGMLAHNTLFIFPLHGLVFSVLTGIVSKGFGIQGWAENGGWTAALIYTLLGIVGSLVAATIFKKFFP